MGKRAAAHSRGDAAANPDNHVHAAPNRNAAADRDTRSNGDGHRVREVRYDAGNAVAHGLPYKAALAALTINPARIFNVANTTGSIERGKSADLVIWTGDPLEPSTQAQTVIIGGIEQPLDTRAQDLARRYKDLNGAMPPAYKQ